jgi:hypothetical protein
MQYVMDLRKILYWLMGVWWFVWVLFNYVCRLRQGVGILLVVEFR